MIDIFARLRYNARDLSQKQARKAAQVRALTLRAMISLTVSHGASTDPSLRTPTSSRSASTRWTNGSPGTVPVPVLSRNPSTRQARATRSLPPLPDALPESHCNAHRRAVLRPKSSCVCRFGRAADSHGQHANTKWTASKRLVGGARSQVVAMKPGSMTR
jgi:hypothetical protein